MKRVKEISTDPFGVGVEAVKALEEGEATMVVYSCDQLFTDDANVMVSGANQMMFVNTVGGFVDHEVSVSIPVKSYQVSYLTVESVRRSVNRTGDYHCASRRLSGSRLCNLV